MINIRYPKLNLLPQAEHHVLNSTAIHSLPIQGNKPQSSTTLILLQRAKLRFKFNGKQQEIMQSKSLNDDQSISEQIKFRVRFNSTKW